MKKTYSTPSCTMIKLETTNFLQAMSTISVCSEYDATDDYEDDNGGNGLVRGQGTSIWDNAW